MLFTPAHSLIDQSLHSKLGAETTNGDGFGIGWYDAAPAPGSSAASSLAWNDANLRELAGSAGGCRAGHRVVEAAGRQRGITYPFQGTIATSDGEGLWAFRYSTEGTSRSLFFSRDVRAVRQLYPDREVLPELSDDARLVVSEPIGDLPGAWNEMPEASYGVVGKGDDQLRSFAVEPPPKVL